MIGTLLFFSPSSRRLDGVGRLPKSSEEITVVLFLFFPLSRCRDPDCGTVQRDLACRESEKISFLFSCCRDRGRKEKKKRSLGPPSASTRKSPDTLLAWHTKLEERYSFFQTSRLHSCSSTFPSLGLLSAGRLFATDLATASMYLPLYNHTQMHRSPDRTKKQKRVILA